jgi:hypothetical protein
MSSLFDQLSQHVDADTIGQFASQIGATPAQTKTAVQAAMPMLLGALARNSATPQGAAGILGALERDHDGSLLDSLAGLLGGGAGASGGGLGEIGGMLSGMLGGSAGSGGGMMDMGGAILGHVFGGKQGNVAATLGKSTGLQSGQILQLLALLAPIVMGVLGRQNKQSGGLDQGGLADILGGAFQKSAAQAPPSVTHGSGAAGAGGIGDLLSSVLDANHDGSVMDDLMKQGGGILGSLLGGPKKG